MVHSLVRFGMIGPYIFENDDKMTVTVNSERYGLMITDFLLSAIEEYDLENRWFQQDEYDLITRDIFWPRNFSTSQLAITIMRFNTIRHFFCAT